jgi:hypothetical protein
VSYWFSNRAQFQQLEKILRDYLWSKYSGDKGFPLVAWDVCTMPKDEEVLGLIDFLTHRSIMVAKLVVWCLEGST